VYDGIITLRSFSSSQGKSYTDQVVISRACSNKCMEPGHYIPLSGRLSREQTRNRLLAHYIWPGIHIQMLEPTVN